MFEEASWIQRLFMVYPKRVVRNILGEKSVPYTGDVMSAESFLTTTYCRAQPSASHCTEARETFEACNWSAPSEDQLAFLNQPPTREEIIGKLKRAKNTGSDAHAPGSDGIEYPYLRVAKEGLADLDVECRKFLGRIAEVPPHGDR